MFLFICQIFFANPALAQPMIGDFAEYEVTSTMNGSPAKSWIVHTEIISYDQVEKAFKVRTTTTAENKDPVHEDAEIAPQTLLDAENKIRLAIRDCTRNGGRFVSVLVPAGRFLSCLQPSHTNEIDSTTWYANTPALAIVRNEQFVHLQRQRSEVRVLKRFRKL